MSPSERADAARNRRAILAAADELFSRHGVHHVSMNDIATAAGVGKATLFRRFTDRTGLVQALLEPRGTELRDAIRTGPPPLGPGGTPAERLESFVEALFDFVWQNRPLIRALENLRPDAYYTNDVSRIWIDHLTACVAAAAPGRDAEYLAHALLTGLRADIIEYLVHNRGMTRQRVLDGVLDLTRSSIA
ncbi:TetR/AcrR family transcriptional regulator [Amycolatopsis nigrescens]|uniref:TetR/AcrR family transcriptional regulator n=1 Tax=Amycolatopsis nigrescens TaxID=381445 RepID=UPI0003818370|nr:TetR/AcrR family transcriptional regulator [Amycolatopsis nigrescens]